MQKLAARMEEKIRGEGDMDSLRATELRLGLPGSEEEPHKPGVSRGSKRTLAAGDDHHEQETEEESSSDACASNDGKEVERTPPTKAQVVGWPPVRSFVRKNCLPASAKAEAETGPGLYVKVSMDGAPYLRKVDLKSLGGYKELRQVMETMFKCCFPSTDGGHRCSSEYVITYEDKDGDWMLAGDVPWEMFASSCKRLRIMKGSEARGLSSSKTS